MSAEVVAVVFAKPPRPGAAKTRLAAELGAGGLEQAAALAAAFLADTVAQLRRHAWLRVVLSTPEPDADHGVDVERRAQGGGDLGARLERVFGWGLREHRAVLALGADSPGIPDEHLAFVRDHVGDAPVLGPTEDGGFWGLLLDRCPEGLLAELPWSARNTGAATVERLAARLRPPVLAPRWWDVDRAGDLDRLAHEVPPDHAPRTHAVLAALSRSGAGAARDPHAGRTARDPR